MCGICGFNWNDPELVARMAAQIEHRGPNQHGFYVDDAVSLGHHRLSIIDLSEQGRQPMANEDGSLRLVYNGEIYNFRELREELLAKGHRFTSRADSEVILHAYEEYGPDAVHKLRGMFAFALWDGPRRRLLLVRDRIGIKPLYYCERGGRIRFASEIKAILEDPSVSREIDPQALYDYLGFEFVPAPQTMFRDIRKLPAGHYLLVENGRTELRQYWDLSFRGRGADLTYGQAVEEVRGQLDFAVKSHLVSDVPLGVFLSGGLDSSAIVAMMRRHITGPLRTFTIGYTDKTFSELDYARQVAEVFATDHKVLMIDDLKPLYVEQALWHLDEPMTDLSAVPLLLVCREAKRHVTVCLSGEGGDESFAGYDRFKASRLDRWYRRLPGLVRRGVVEPLAAALPDRPGKKGAVNMFKRFIEGANLPEDGGHLRWQYFLGRRQEARLFNDRFKAAVQFDPFRQVRQAVAACDAADPVNRELYLDMRFMMTDSVLMKVDKMSMASALEIRVPFLDHRFVEFVASLPGSWKLRGLRTKQVLRSALRGVLPDRIVNRGKQGYSLPVKNLLRDGMRQYMIDLLNQSPLIRATMNVDDVNRLIREHVDRVHNHNHLLWAMINCAIWQARFNVGV